MVPFLHSISLTSIPYTAVSDSHADRKLYYQLTGDLKETTSTTNITLAIGINSSPHYDAPTASEKGVLDVEPVVPDDVE